MARDRASNALTVYLSRPLTSSDYLLGKLGIVAGIIVLLWTGPLLLGWLLSLLLAPDRDFFVYSAAPLGRALLFNGIAMVALAAIALAVSAATKRSSYAILLWLGLWLILGGIAKGPQTPDWLRHASFSYDLEQTRRDVLRVGQTFARASEDLPFLSRELKDGLAKAGEKTNANAPRASLAGLGILVVISTLVFSRRLRAE